MESQAVEQAGAREDPEVARNRDAVREEIRLSGANINPESLLATDYLNHFNEIIMLLDLAAEMPDCFEDAAGWQPLGYREHFLRSNLADGALAAEAYDAAPVDIRRRFDATVAELDVTMERGIEECLSVLEAGDAGRFPLICHDLARAARGHIDVLSAIIHCTERETPLHVGLESTSLEDAQQTIDSLFGN